MKGSIVDRYKDPKKWSLVIELGYVPDPVTGTLRRKQQWFKFHGTKKEAQTKLHELITAYEHGELVAPSKITVLDWLRSWLDKSVKPLKRKNTYDAYRAIIEAHIAKAPLGAMALQKVRPSDVEAYLASLKLAPNTIELHYSVLRGSFKKARRDQLIRVTPAVDIERRKPAKDALQTSAKLNCWSAMEARAFMAAAIADGPQSAAFFALALDTGARKSELLGLDWKQVDLDAATVTISRQITSTSGEPTFGPTKSGTTRSVVIDARTVNYLRAHRRVQAELIMRNRTTYRDYGLVFAKEEADLKTTEARLGDPMTRLLDEKAFERGTKAAGLRKITCHGLRHTCITLLLSDGVPLHEVSARVGHSKPSVTLDVYAHALPTKQAAAAAKIGALIHG